MDTAIFIAPTSFTSDGMTLRAYQPGDGPELCVATTSSYAHLRPWMLWATPEDSAEAAEVRCRRFAARYLLNEDFVLGIWVGDQLAGGTGFHRSIPFVRHCERSALAVPHKNVFLGGGKAAPKPPLNAGGASVRPACARVTAPSAR